MTTRDRHTPVVSHRSAWLHPASLAVAGSLLVLLGVAIALVVTSHAGPPPVPRSAAVAGAPRDGAAPGTRTVARAASTAAANVAYDAMVRGRYGEALAGYEAVLEREPGNVEALSHAAILAAKAGQDGRALRLLDQVLAMDPRFPTTLLIRAELFYRASDMRAAIAALDRYLAVAPAGPDRDTAERLLASARRQRSAPAR